MSSNRNILIWVPLSSNNSNDSEDGTLILNTLSTTYQTYPAASTTPPHDPGYLQVYARRPRNQEEENLRLESRIGGPASDDLGLETLLGQRQEIVDAKVQMILSEIFQRRLIKDQNLYRINLDQCSFRTLTFALGEHCWDKRRLELERRIIDLEEEKRTEETGYFKDILFLRKELRESLIERIEDEQKAKLIMGMDGESP
jgi:hypothetical protein